jgi:hypothetical protein
MDGERRLGEAAMLYRGEIMGEISRGESMGRADESRSPCARGRVGKGASMGEGFNVCISGVLMIMGVSGGE